MKNCVKLLSLLCTISLCVADQLDDPTLVTLPDGQIQGQVLRSPNNKIYYAFQEIPYAAPPVGDLRLQAPVPPTKWDGVLNTTKNEKICYQSGNLDQFPVSIAEFTQTEDCLYLNVYTPQKPGDDSETPLPVLIWIHGGGNTYGSGVFKLYKPYLYIDYDIVVVTINYRLGALGFLTTEDGVIPGNIGLKDQHLAMQWVKKNINLFGGDPEKITISGESAGSGSVTYHVVSQKNKGLFRGGIMQSGSAIATRLLQTHARPYAFEVGRNLDRNFTSDDSKDLLALLRSVPASDINDNTYISTGSVTVIVLEDANLEGALITDLLYENIRTGNINQVPILMGFNSEEQLLFTKDNPSILETRAKGFDDDLSSLIGDRFNMTKENKLTAGTRLRQAYTDGLFADDLGAVLKFSSDASFSTPMTRHAKLQSNYTDIYLYQLSYKGKMGNLKDVEVAGVQGVGHGEDLGYLWDTWSNETPDDSKDLVTRQRMLTLWSNFIKYLNPTPEKDSLLNNVTWSKVTPNNLVYLNINDILEIEKNPKEYLQWERIIDIYAIPPLTNY